MKNIYKRIIVLAIVAVAISSSARSVQAETYTSDLTLGSTGSQVISLQTWLESNGYLTMPQGVSKGYFGGITRTALASYQKSIGLPAYGFFGSMTRERLNRGGDNNVGVLNVISPNGGEMWQKGTTQNITWQDPFVVSGCPVGAYCSMAMPRYYNVKLLKYSSCDSLTPCIVQAPYVLAENISEKTLTWNVGDYNNTSGSSVIPDGQYKIQVCTVAGNICDISDSYFTIKSSATQSPITVLSPNGGEKLSIGSNHQIRWANTNTSYGSKVDLYMTPVVACPMIYPTPASCYPADIILDKNIDTNMIYNWIVGTDTVNNPIPSGNYMVKVCVAGTNSCDSSNGMFSLIGGNVSSTISPDLLPSASTNVYYRQALKVAGLSTSTVQWEVIEGALPPGLYLEKAHVSCTTALTSDCNIPDSMMFEASIGGQATREGNYAFKIKAHNNTQSVTKSYNINVGSGFTLRTDKSRYYTNDPINMTVTAYNSTNQPKVFNFNSGCQTTYRINNTSGANFFDSSTNLNCTQQLTSVVVPAMGSYTWSITHNPSTYRLSVGTYKIFGTVIGQAHFESEPFNVVQ